MLDKPPIQDADLIQFLRDQYGLDIADIQFLPIGADSQAAVYHVMTTDKTPYFLKLKRGNFDTMTVQIPHLIRENQIAQVVAPQLTQSKQLSAQYKEFHVILYPYVDGQDGYTRHLAPHHWEILGRALRGIHTINIPPDIQSRLRRENFTPYWRDVVTAYLARIQHEQPQNPLESELATLLHANRPVVNDLIQTAHKLGTILQNQPLEFVLCHGDIHAWNVLIDEQGQLFIVDWDDAILAPKERDLMFIGAGIGGIWDKPEERTWFFDGYGQVDIHYTALAYYRNERIVQDIAVTILDITSDTHSIENKHLMLQQLAGQFAPNSRLIPIAKKTAQSVE
ncbi:MAG: phosphotransferase [Anaerolineae bacterium]|nr:phosphotransferase [Anaerolineae bacterium]